MTLRSRVIARVRQGEIRAMIGRVDQAAGGRHVGRMAREEVTLASIDRRLQEVERAGRDAGGLATDVALVKRDIRWVMLIGAAIVAGIGYLHTEVSAIQDDVAELDTAVARIEATQAAHGERLGRIESGLERIETLLAE
ncbi:MAG: hypothetical protein OXH76_20860 [Boseongicola sp.]|nr:hypothetical protein [Boseongicola sp.]